MERIIDRFDKYMSFRGLNDNMVTRDLSFSVGLIGKSRKEGRDLSRNATESILKFYTDIDPVWLKTGEGEMLKMANSSICKIANNEIAVNSFCDFEKFRHINGLKKTFLAEYLGVSNFFITQFAQGSRSLPEDKLRLLKDNDMGWDVSMFKSPYGYLLPTENLTEKKDFQRLIEVISFLREDRKVYNAKDFAKMVGVQPSYVSEATSNKRSITAKFTAKIELAFPQINGKYILTGEGEMLKMKGMTARHHNAPDMETLHRQYEDTIARLEEIIREQQETIRNQQETINRLQDHSTRLLELITQASTSPQS